MTLIGRGNDMRSARGGGEVSYSFVIPAFEPVSSKYGLLVKPGMT